MKNLKKLFVVLPLVLVMLLSVVPVLAQPVAEGKKDDALFQTILNDTKFTAQDTADWLSIKGEKMPIWVGENKPFAEGDVANTKIVLLKGGAVHGWVKANYDAVSPLAVAQKYVAENMPEYNIPSYQILNVLKVEKQVKVPDGYQAKPNTKTEKVVIGTETKCGEPKFANDSFFAAKGQAYANKDALEQDFENVDFDGNTGIYTFDFGTQKGWTATANAANITLDQNVYNFKAGDAVPEAEQDDIVWTAYESGTLKQSGILPGFGKVTENILVYCDVTEQPKYSEREVKVIDENKLVDVTIKGLLIVVEESNLPVAITHHFVFADGTEIVQTSEQKWAKNAGELAIATVNPAWYMTVPGFTIDTTKTAVAGVYDEDNYLVLGEKVLKSYKVDLYYTAGEGADKGQVDAALAGNAANVANAQQLPATGAADSFALVLSSLALVVVGLFFKK